MILNDREEIGAREREFRSSVVVLLRNEEDTGKMDRSVLAGSDHIVVRW